MNIKIQNQWKIIKHLAKTFKDNGILYHFDGSTAVFAHGIEFDMDDIDIVFPFDKINEVREFFNEYKPSEIGSIQSLGLKHFHFYINDEKIHCLFYEGSYENFSDEDVEVIKDGQKIWAKSLSFYLRYAKKDDVLVPRIYELLNTK